MRELSLPSWSTSTKFNDITAIESYICRRVLRPLFSNAAFGDVQSTREFIGRMLVQFANLRLRDQNYQQQSNKRTRSFTRKFYETTLIAQFNERLWNIQNTAHARAKTLADIISIVVNLNKDVKITTVETLKKLTINNHRLLMAMVQKRRYEEQKQFHSLMSSSHHPTLRI